MLQSTVFVILSLARAAQPQALCVSQPCVYPNQCLNKPEGTSVCVRDPAPTCDYTSCPAGQHCILQQDSCTSLPCEPQPTCVTHNPCQTCAPPNKFCELNPAGRSQKPACRLVVEENCFNMVCPYGQTCQETPKNCGSNPSSPCEVELECV